MLGSSAVPRRQPGITIKMIIVPEVASRTLDRKGWENGTNVKETICRFQRAARPYMRARVLVLIAAVNASNFTRLISLSLAARRPVPEARRWTRGNERKEKRRRQRDDNFAIQIRDLSDNSSPSPSPPSPPPLSRVPVAPE